jgi:hypothetical protein
MRERVRHGEVGRKGFDEGADRRTGGRPAASPPRPWRRVAGPRPVRPGVAPVAVRPAEAPRPVWPAGVPAAERCRDARTGLRLLARPGATSQCTARHRRRRAVAGLALVAASAAVVVALGLLARLAEPVVAPAPVASVSVAVDPPAPVVVTVEPGETVWEVADRVAPGLSGPRRAALAERIVADNALPSVRPQAGQVLRVATG